MSKASQAAFLICFLKQVQKSIPGAGQRRKRRLGSQASSEPRQDLEPTSALLFGSSHLLYGQASEALSKSLCGSGHWIPEFDNRPLTSFSLIDRRVTVLFRVVSHKTVNNFHSGEWGAGNRCGRQH